MDLIFASSEVEMKDYTRSFKKIIPSIRECNLDAINQTPLKGNRVMIPCRDCQIEVFIHKARSSNAPVLFEFHGGGFVLGDASKNDNICEIIKDALDINVIGVNYRKAPEHPYPAAINDAYDVVKYFSDHASELKVDKNRFALMGFSAGATLSTITAMQAVATRAFHIQTQILHYPYVDGASDPSSKKGHPADLPIEVMEAFIELYGENINPSDPYISPLYASLEQLKDTASATIFMAGEDALCEEGLAYANRLAQAGVTVNARVIANMHHGYMEDYYNKACYELNPPDTIAKHSKDMEKCSEETMKDTIEALEYWLK